MALHRSILDGAQNRLTRRVDWPQAFERVASCRMREGVATCMPVGALRGILGEFHVEGSAATLVQGRFETAP